ncbi:MAG: aminotransferase class I/II-fold pyridoxal phosphate-dependent enzyme [bacterium]|nr:aminotransferase class I/II-fold pyridoxal phosphate-dependent enzyme [bacterium]
MRPIDMRSDTVTRPTPAMLAAMADAELGDDVFGDDPTVNRLQERVADLLGKEAALYVPSGTMGNQLAVRAQARAGDQVVLEDGAHIYRYEAGAPAVLTGVQLTCVPAPGGLLDWPLVKSALNPDNVHCAPPSLVCLENTHNRAGGRIMPQSDVVAIAAGAHARGLCVHLDGARLWHAHVATGTALADLAAPADTVSVCFSKGLGAPVGSVLAGDAGAMATAYRFRKMLGGGMRQAGLLAAACLHALDHHLERLAEDHDHAQHLAGGLANPHLKINHPVDTNIVIFDVADPGGDEALLEHLAAGGVLGVGFGPGRVRLVPNLDTSAADVRRALDVLNAYTGVES